MPEKVCAAGVGGRTWRLRVRARAHLHVGV